MTLPVLYNPGMYDQIFHNLRTPLDWRSNFFRTIKLAKMFEYKRMSLPENMKGAPPTRAEDFPPIGMGPAVWGPIFWKMMHIVTIGYSHFPTEEEQRAAINFFESLQYMIPCPICKEHYKANLAKFPVANVVDSKEKLIRWLFDMHNTINMQLGKPEITWREFVYSMINLAVLPKFSFETATSNQDGRSLFDTQSLLYMVAGIGMGVGGYIAYKHYTKS